MARSKEEGRMTKQNARAFRREVENLLSGMQAKLDQMTEALKHQVALNTDLIGKNEKLFEANKDLSNAVSRLSKADENAKGELEALSKLALETSGAVRDLLSVMQKSEVELTAHKLTPEEIKAAVSEKITEERIASIESEVRRLNGKIDDNTEDISDILIRMPAESKVELTASKPTDEEVVSCPSEKKFEELTKPKAKSAGRKKKTDN
jgi:hypothetical protein